MLIYIPDTELAEVFTPILNDLFAEFNNDDDAETYEVLTFDPDTHLDYFRAADVEVSRSKSGGINVEALSDWGLSLPNNPTHAAYYLGGWILGFVAAEDGQYQ